MLEEILVVWKTYIPIGEINDKNNENIKTYIDGIGTNHLLNQVEFINCYYLENTITGSDINTTISENAESKTSIQMKSEEFLETLNQENNEMWKFSSGKNNGYPVLYWE